jgi:hypothetical protein
MLDDGDDDRFDEYPPTPHPGREMATMSLAAILVIAFIAWAIWKIMLWL